jgi:hypothetical protein
MTMGPGNTMQKISASNLDQKHGKKSRLEKRGEENPDRRKNMDKLVHASTYQRQTAAQSVMKRQFF